MAMPPKLSWGLNAARALLCSGSKQGAKFSARMAAENRLPSTAPPPVSSSSSTGPSGGAHVTCVLKPVNWGADNCLANGAYVLNVLLLDA